ncbi:MAG: MFS transporter [Peptococcaceae bacterium]|nr:MFS transporter [Peptococcaceae bacterium]
MRKFHFNTEAGIKIFLIISALIGLATGLSDSLLANYFKDAYGINAQQRGLVELPREIPGVISMFLIAALAFIKNTKIAVVAQIFSAAGLVVLAFIRPSFSVMLIFLFVYSMGVHMFLTLGDSIGLSLSRKENMGRTLGRFNSIRMAFMMVAGVMTFFGFHFGWFSFETPVAVFLLSVVCFILVALLLIVLPKAAPETDGAVSPDTKLVFKKEYARYYVICALYGGRKQIMLVYSPWVLIELLNFKADTISILAVIGAMIGIFFMPVVGKSIDRLGIRKVMLLEAMAFINIYIAYGILSKWVSTHEVVLTGLIMMLVYLLNILDRMSAQFAMVRSIYMRHIALTPEDVTPSLSLGMSIDHVVAIAGSYVCGVIWYNFGPEYVFVLAGLLSFVNMLVVRGIQPESGGRMPPLRNRE